MPTETLPGPAHRNSFDLVRLLAALSVFLAHQLNIAGYVLPGYGQVVVGPSAPKLADAGLYAFFALSGYLVFHSLDADPRPKRFALARILRIYPGAVVNTVACVLFGAAVTSLSVRDYWGDAATWRFLLHNAAIVILPTEFQLPGVLGESRWPSVNVPLWTLKHELLCYVVLFVMYRLTGRWLRPALAAMVLLATAAFIGSRIVPTVGFDSLADLGLVHVARFFMVFFASALYAATGPWGGRARVGGAALLAATWLLAPFEVVRFTAATLLIGFGALELGRSRLLFSPAYHRIGDLSYGTYLYAFPLQMFTLTRWLTPWNVWLLTALDLVLTLALAFASWRLVERPMMRLKPRSAGAPSRNVEALARA